MNSTSESLLLRLRSSRDDQAWSRFVELYTPMIFFWAKKTGLQSQDASDLVQDVFSVVFRKLPDFQYDRTKSFRGWLRTVTLNKHRQHCRKKSINAIVTSQSQLVDVLESESFWDLNYKQALVGRALEMMRSDFEPATWEALKEFVTTKSPAKIIAQRHNVSVWTIYSAKSRLLSRLRMELDGLLEL